MKTFGLSTGVCLFVILEVLTPGCTTTKEQPRPAPRSTTSVEKQSVSTPSPTRKPAREKEKEKVVDKATTEPKAEPIPDEPSVQADDTGKNVRDRSGKTLTPLDQSSDPRDIEITRQIRKAVMADDTLSTTAKNIKIITIDGTATLRGPVETDDERLNIFNKAKTVANGKVDNQLEVTARR